VKSADEHLARAAEGGRRRRHRRGARIGRSPQRRAAPQRQRRHVPHRLRERLQPAFCAGGGGGGGRRGCAALAPRRLSARLCSLCRQAKALADAVTASASHQGHDIAFCSFVLPKMLDLHECVSMFK